MKPRELKGKGKGTKGAPSTSASEEVSMGPSPMLVSAVSAVECKETGFLLRNLFQVTIIRDLYYIIWLPDYYGTLNKIP